MRSCVDFHIGSLLTCVLAAKTTPLLVEATGTLLLVEGAIPLLVEATRTLLLVEGALLFIGLTATETGCFGRPG